VWLQFPGGDIFKMPRTRAISIGLVMYPPVSWNSIHVG
jgi:hypothetical protein